ncbi:DUF2946 domain-containing protein [Roseomonas stagni]|uniref:DUF2946 domain-containing protein n=1 Tax=Falsiroseomonas algicola TaxID=2716930 RepID=A0A6M1LQW7_9PROT|nr:DUF2946 family protein [Falsiroseomonas algicola]NGM22801.1 DUF2946 domain-containing protein [Falsiroseomonas algicola]
MYGTSVRLRPALIRLLTILLLLQWGTAFGHCLRMASPEALLHLEICTPDGIQRIAMPAAEEGADPAQPSPAHPPAVICPACAGPAAVALPPPPVSLVAPMLLVQASPPAPPSTPSPAPPPRCQPPPRAPPTS